MPEFLTFVKCGVLRMAIAIAMALFFSCFLVAVVYNLSGIFFGTWYAFGASIPEGYNLNRTLLNTCEVSAAFILVLYEIFKKIPHDPDLYRGSIIEISKDPDEPIRR